MEIALFRFGVISDFINQLDYPKGKKTALLKYKIKQKWTIPFSTKTSLSESCIRKWFYRYCKSGKKIESLFPKDRNDKNSIRSISDEDAEKIVKIIQKKEVKNISKLLSEMKNNKIECNASRSTIYRFVKNKNLTCLLKNKELDNGITKSNLEIDKDWLISLVQCRITLSELITELENKLPIEDIRRLYNCLLNDRLYFRKRAISILSKFKGIPKQAVEDCLFIPLKSQWLAITKYKTNGIDSVFSDKKSGSMKHEDPNYIEKVFSILHAPPSSYGFNRTSWKQEDIQKVMDECDMHVCKNVLRKIINSSGFKYKKARKVLTSHDPNYKEKVGKIKNILENLKPNEKFFSIDEYGPFSVKLQGGKSLVPPGTINLVPQWQKSKGSIIITASLELSTNQITHFYSKNKNTEEMIKLLHILLKLYSNKKCLYLSWDAASWHISKKLNKEVDKINTKKYKLGRNLPTIELAPLPTGAQFLNVIESVFSGMARAIIHNSDYKSVDECKEAIDQYFLERNERFRKNPKRAGNKIWKKERVIATFNESNNCKDPMYS